MSATDRFFRDNLEHSLLHRLPNLASTTICGLFDVALIDQLFFDSVRFASADKCAVCFEDQEFTDVHTSHCCTKHGCKYGNEYCTVTRGVRAQQYPCEACGWEEEQMQERGEHYEYGIVSEYGESKFGGAIDVLPGDLPAWLKKDIKVVRRRVSEWELF